MKYLKRFEAKTQEEIERLKIEGVEKRRIREADKVKKEAELIQKSEFTKQKFIEEYGPDNNKYPYLSDRLVRYTNKELDIRFIDDPSKRNVSTYSIDMNDDFNHWYTKFLNKVEDAGLPHPAKSIHIYLQNNKRHDRSEWGNIRYQVRPDSNAIFGYCEAPIGYYFENKPYSNSDENFEKHINNLMTTKVSSLFKLGKMTYKELSELIKSGYNDSLFLWTESPCEMLRIK